MGEKSEIRINPEETSLLVEMLKLKMKGYTSYKIAKKLKMAQTSVNRRLEHLERDFPRILRFVRAIQKVKYFEKKHRERFFESPEAYTRLVSHIHRILSQGVPLATGSATAGRKNAKRPGYKQVGNRVEVDPETIPLAKKIFETYYNGGNMRKLCREHGLDPSSVRRAMKNPLYIGIIKRDGKEYFFPQLALIDREIWKTCLSSPPEGTYSMFGFIRGRRDPEKAPIVEKVIKLRLEGKTYKAIMDKLKIKQHTVVWILKNPKYANKVLKDGKYVDAGVEEIIPFPRWLEAHNIKGKRLYEEERKRETIKISRVLTFLEERKPQAFSCREIAVALELTLGSVRRYLHKLEGSKLVKNISSEGRGKRGAPLPSKWRVVV